MRHVIEETPTKPESTQDEWVKALLSQVRSLRFGVVQIVVHDSRVVQIERTEKFRFDQINQNRPPHTVEA